MTSIYRGRMVWGWLITTSSLLLKVAAVQFAERLQKRKARLLQSIMTTPLTKYAGSYVPTAIIDSWVVTVGIWGRTLS